jgi:hypothetical protein
MISVPGALAGAAVGAGFTLIAAGWRRPPPDLRTVLARLDGTTTAERSHTRGSPASPARGVDHGPDGDGSGSRTGLAARCAAWLTDVLADIDQDIRNSPAARMLRWERLAADLALLGESLELLAVRKLGYLLLGLAFPPVLAGVVAVIGTWVPWGASATAALALGGVLFMVPDLDVRARATAARADLRSAVGAYLELVALERAADAGAIEALERAAAIGQTPAFDRIRAALTRAELDGVPPWRGLRDLADQTGVPELGDLADIMASSGRDGAAVYSSLRARAASLRTAITAERAAAANATSERMVIPVATLGLVFMALVAYPALVRLIGP